MLEVYGISVDLPYSSAILPKNKNKRASKDANDDVAGEAGDKMEEDASDAGSDECAYESMDEVGLSSIYYVACTAPTLPSTSTCPADKDRLPAWL